MLAERSIDPKTARAMYDECADLARAVGNDWFLALARGNSASAAVETGDFETAVRRGTEAVQLLRTIGDQQSESAYAPTLAAAELGLGQREAGIARIAAFLEKEPGRDLPEPTLWCLETMAMVLLGEAPDSSARILGATGEIADEYGSGRRPGS
jgi:hypothetical protein